MPENVYFLFILNGIHVLVRYFFDILETTDLNVKFEMYITKN